MERFLLKEYTEKAESLLEETMQSFDRLELSKNQLPATMQPKEGAVKLVFVGQYSAGKSSIIKMLTGMDVETGAGITTQQSHVYHWDDIEVVDTPGIQTGLRPDHDEITYKEINQAALLIFVVTNEGFDRHMAEHFQKLAVEKKRGKNMMLVVNKMDRANLGNTKEQQDIMLEDIAKVVAPFQPEQLYTTFVSTESYEEAREETDEEMKKELLEESGLVALVNHLNAFVKEKDLASRVIAPVHNLKSVLDHQVGTQQDNLAVDKMEALWKRKQRIYADAKEDALHAIQDAAMNMQADIKHIGQEAAQCVPAKSEDAIEAALKEKYEQACQRERQCEAEMEDIINQMMKDVDAEVAEEKQSALALSMFSMAEAPHVPYDMAVRQDASAAEEPSALGSLMEQAKETARKEVMNGFLNNSAQEAGKKVGNNIMQSIWRGSLKDFSGGLVHQGVKGVGKFFGVKFKPWEAVKCTKFLGGVAVIASLLYTIYDAVQSDEKQRENENNLREARDNIRQQFHKMAEEAYTKLLSDGRQEVEKKLADATQDVERHLTEIAEGRMLQAKRQEELGALQQKADALIDLMGA